MALEPLKGDLTIAELASVPALRQAQGKLRDGSPSSVWGLQKWLTAIREKAIIGGNWDRGREPLPRKVKWEIPAQILIGSPETVARKVEGQMKAGYTHIIGTMDAGGRMPLKKLRKSMELIANRVVPEFRSAARR